VSEYQYYEFTAIDRPLTTREQSELRSLSTRAEITAGSFVNTYEWGNFKGDPRKLMERYFDAHLYLTNWGTRELMLRLPKRVLDPAVVADYCVGDSAYAWTSGKHLIIRLNREDEDGTDEWDIGGEGLLSSIIGVRASLAAGDPRLLYLGWLRCVQSLEVSHDAPEPPVPAGLATLDAPLTAVAEFLCIDRDLITAAAAGSTTTTPRTAGELLVTVGELRAEREGRDAQQRERDRVRQERSAAVARQRHLDTLAVDQPAVWQRIDELIATKKPREYDSAVQLLVDLRDLTERDGGTAAFEHRLTVLRVAHARKPSLLQRLDLAGLDV
jgi:hypothetical protein